MRSNGQERGPPTRSSGSSCAKGRIGLRDASSPAARQRLLPRLGSARRFLARRLRQRLGGVGGQLGHRRRPGGGFDLEGAGRVRAYKPAAHDAPRVEENVRAAPLPALLLREARWRGRVCVGLRFAPKRVERALPAQGRLRVGRDLAHPRAVHLERARLLKAQHAARGAADARDHPPRGVGGGVQGPTDGDRRAAIYGGAARLVSTVLGPSSCPHALAPHHAAGALLGRRPVLEKGQRVGLLDLQPDDGESPSRLRAPQALAMPLRLPRLVLAVPRDVLPSLDIPLGASMGSTHRATMLAGRGARTANEHSCKART